MKTFILLADGSSDRMLLSPIQWLLGEDWTGEIADLSRLPRPPKTLPDRIKKALELQGPCDMLFVHRDAEAVAPDLRREEIFDAINECFGTPKIPCIPIVPVRMTEAWFLFNEAAIRQAAQKPNSKSELDIPKYWDRIPDPKTILFQALCKASGRTGRDLKKFNPQKIRHQLAEDLADFSPLLSLPAFQTLQIDIKTALSQPR